MKVNIHFTNNMIPQMVTCDVESKEQALSAYRFLKTVLSNCEMEFVDDIPIEYEVCPTCGQMIMPKFEIDFSHRKPTLL